MNNKEEMYIGTAGRVSPRSGEQAKPNIYINTIQPNLWGGYFMVTVKDNKCVNYSDLLAQSDLIIVANAISEHCEGEIETHEYETGDQGKLHIHAICKGDKNKLQKIEVLSKRLKMYPPVDRQIHYNQEEDKTVMLKHIINMKSYTYQITPITSEEHYKNSLEYIKKEKLKRPSSPQFID